MFLSSDVLRFFFSADMVASFRLQRTVNELKENISRLEYDIYGEVGSPGTIVCLIIFLSFLSIPAQQHYLVPANNH